MKITCHACDAKYTIADEKVTGRTVKIKCKKCGATIVVAADPSAAGGGAVTGAPGYAEPAHGGGDEDSLMATRVAGQDGAPPSISSAEWTVSLGEQERQMSQLQMAEAMQSGAITGDTYVWRDGMGDWLSVSQIPELASLLARAAGAAPAHAYAPPPAIEAPPHYQEEPQLGLAGTMVMTESPMMAGPPAAAAPRPAAGMPAASTPAPAGLSPVNQPTAARRANRAAGPTVDVFQAAAENQQPREPEKARPKPPTPAGRLGERNENSVLFSLSALTATENAAAKPGSSDESVTDFGLGGGTSGRNGKSSMDDIMNLGGGGIGGGPMLAPPPLLAPVVEPPPAPAPMPVSAMPAPGMGMGAGMGASPYGQPVEQPKKKTGLIIGIVAAVLVVGGVGAVFALGGSGDPSGQTAATSSGTASAPATTTAPAASTPSVTSAPATTEAPVAGTDPPAGSSAVASNDTKGQSGTSTTPGGKPGTAPTTSASTKASAAPTVAATAAPTATDTGASTAAGRDFNKGAATTALSAAAGRAKGCKQADGPTGSASVRVVFAPSGNVTSANVQGPPFAGTPVGGCIASAFRGASVPPFDGSPVAVSKTVNIN